MFPLYRKSKDAKNFFKILNNKEFIQLKVIGSKVRKFQYKFDKYPEIMTIMDMIDSDFYDISNEFEFLNIHSRI
jgi:hypothetical protein